MKIVVYGPERRVGVWEDDRVIDVARAYETLAKASGSDGEALPSQLLPLIEMGAEGLAKTRRAVEHAKGAGSGNGTVFALEEVQLHAPWPGRRIACVGGNVAAHLHGMYANRPGGTTKTIAEVTNDARDGGQWGFWKVPADVLGPGGEIPYPARTSYLDYEGEPAIVFGARGKDISADQYRSFVWGITLLHDASLRDGMGSQQPRGMSYNLAKNFDGATGIGPCIVVGDIDPENVVVETSVNGELRQRFNTGDMIFPWGEIVEYLSKDFTFVPGDVISGGTGAGTAADKTPRGPDGSRSSELFLKRGDEVVVSSPDIGELPIRVV